MPSSEEHCRLSELRTGKKYAELHKWMDEFQKEMGRDHREKRHSLNDIEEVKKRWGEEAVQEFLVHVIADYKDTTNKLLKVLNELIDEKKCIREKLQNSMNEYDELLYEAQFLEYASLAGAGTALSPKFKKKMLIS